MTFPEALEKIRDVAKVGYGINVTPLLLAMAEQIEANRKALEELRTMMRIAGLPVIGHSLTDDLPAGHPNKPVVSR